MYIKLIDAKQAKEVYQFKNIKRNLYNFVKKKSHLVGKLLNSIHDARTRVYIKL